MINLFNMAVTSMFILVIMGIISNTNNKAFTEVENQIFLMNCPYPLTGAIANNTNIDGLTVTYDIVYDNSTEDYHLTIFHCEVTDPNTPLYAVSTEVLTTSNDWFNVGTSYFAYAMQYIQSFAQKAIGGLTLFSFILTPANFSILGYTLADLGGIALATVVMLYLFSYAMIITWLWVTFNPLKGGSG